MSDHGVDLVAQHCNLLLALVIVLLLAATPVDVLARGKSTYTLLIAVDELFGVFCGEMVVVMGPDAARIERCARMNSFVLLATNSLLPSPSVH